MRSLIVSIVNGNRTMNIPSLFKTVYQSVSSITPRILSTGTLTAIANRNIHYVCNRLYVPNLSKICMNQVSLSGFLQPSLPTYNAVCGLKMKTRLRRRCNGCLLVWKEGRRYIKCKKKPKHNQVERQKKSYNTWILTHASQKPVREW